MPTGQLSAKRVPLGTTSHCVLGMGQARGLPQEVLLKC